MRRARAASLGSGTLLFVDEIHRFNRAQQDSFLPYMEDGTVILVGATTENPSFELNSALLSRASVLTFKRLDEEGLKSLLARAEAHEGRKLPLTDDARAALIAMADGDGRAVITLAEDVWLAAASGAKTPLDREALVALVQRRAPIYDKISGRPLQSDQRAAQIGARLRPRRLALLARAHACRRRGPALHRAAAGAHGDRGHRPRRS